jgi:hypothetical protein
MPKISKHQLQLQNAQENAIENACHMRCYILSSGEGEEIQFQEQGTNTTSATPLSIILSISHLPPSLILLSLMPLSLLLLSLIPLSLLPFPAPLPTPFPTIFLPVACQPLQPHFSIVYYLKLFTIKCFKCRANHWIEERTSGSSTHNPTFSICCAQGKVSLPAPVNPPKELANYLQDQTSGKHFFFSTFLKVKKKRNSSLFAVLLQLERTLEII